MSILGHRSDIEMSYFFGNVRFFMTIRTKIVYVCFITSKFPICPIIYRRVDLTNRAGGGPALGRVGGMASSCLLAHNHDPTQTHLH